MKWWCYVVGWCWRAFKGKLFEVLFPSWHRDFKVHSSLFLVARCISRCAIVMDRVNMSSKQRPPCWHFGYLLVVWKSYGQPEGCSLLVTNFKDKSYWFQRLYCVAMHTQPQNYLKKSKEGFLGMFGKFGFGDWTRCSESSQFGLRFGQIFRTFARILSSARPSGPYSMYIVCMYCICTISY